MMIYRLLFLTFWFTGIGSVLAQEKLEITTPAAALLFQQSMKDYSAKEYTKAIAGFEKFCKEYPDEKACSQARRFTALAFIKLDQPLKALPLAESLIDSNDAVLKKQGLSIAIAAISNAPHDITRQKSQIRMLRQLAELSLPAEKKRLLKNSDELQLDSIYRQWNQGKQEEAFVEASELRKHVQTESVIQQLTAFELLKEGDTNWPKHLSISFEGTDFPNRDLLLRLIANDSVEKKNKDRIRLVFSMAEKSPQWNSVEWLSLRGQQQLADDKPALALDIYQQLLNRQTDNLEASKGVITCLVRMEKWHDALKNIEAYQKKLTEKQITNDSTMDCLQGICLFHTQQWNLASKQLETWLKQGHSKNAMHPEVMFLLAVAYQKQNQRDNALRQYRSFVQLYPTHKSAKEAELQIQLLR